MLKSSLRTCSVLAARASAVCAAFIVLLFVSLLPASTAVAAGPATVTVRVEGATETLVPSTEVTTTTEPVVNGGNPPADSCPEPAVSARCSLPPAATGKVRGTAGKSRKGYSKVWDIRSKQLLARPIRSAEAPTGTFGSTTRPKKNTDSAVRKCRPAIRCCSSRCHYEEGKECPNPLAIEAPASADVGKSVQVTVKRYNAKGEASPANGATVTGASTAATTDSGGHATVSFSSAGEVTLQASASESVRGRDHHLRAQRQRRHVWHTGSWRSHADARGYRARAARPIPDRTRSWRRRPA